MPAAYPKLRENIVTAYSTLSDRLGEPLVVVRPAFVAAPSRSLELTNS
jgi:hypothetical protein